jgi:phosphomevalonate kinase
MIASAPGKVLLAGEYAVLEGHAAVVVAVDRRAVAETTDTPQTLSPFLEALAVEAPAARRVRVDTSALAFGGKKLGLGSSAAAVVAAAAAATGSTDVHALAHRAHARAQGARGARGSGADIAAAVHGGVLRVVRPAGADDETPLDITRLPDPPPFVLLWTGAPADTPTLVARTRALGERDPAGYAGHMAALGAAADQLAAAADAAAAIAAIAAGAEALAHLADASGAPLVPPGFAAVAALAGRFGGAAKPTGAGGGDLLVALFPTPDDAAAFRAAAARQRMIPVAAAVSRDGVWLAKSPV